MSITPGVPGGMHSRNGMLGGSIPEGELRRAEPDAIDSASGDQHLLLPIRPACRFMLSLRDVKRKSGGPVRTRRNSCGPGVSR